MKLPAWLENELEEVGRKVLSGETAHKAAAGILADQIAGDERFTHAVAAAFARMGSQENVTSGPPRRRSRAMCASMIEQPRATAITIPRESMMWEESP